MIKNIARLEHKIGEKLFHFYCESDSSLADVKDALVQFMGYVSNVENTIKAQSDKSQSAPVTEDAPKE